MADKNNFSEVVESLFRGMDTYMAAKTVVGEPITVDDTIIIPLVDVSFGLGAGAGMNNDRKTNNGNGGMGGKLSPNSVLVIKDGITRLVSVKSQDTVNKVLDMVPGVVDRVSGFAAGRGNPLRNSDVKEAVSKASKSSGEKKE